MRRNLMIASAALLISFQSAAAYAQNEAAEHCDGPVYSHKEMTRPARTISKPEPGFTEEARQNGVSGAVRLKAVFCRTGHVTDVQVLEGLPHGLTEKAIEATKRVTFTPGEKDGQTVSQSVSFIYNFNIGDRGPNSEEDDCFKKPERCNGLLVEEVEFQGNVRLTNNQLFRLIRTRPGDRYDAARIQADLRSLLSSPAFDKKETYVSAGRGARGVIVSFTVEEIPVIRTVEIYGLSSMTAEELTKALRDKRIGVGAGEFYSREKVEAAVDAIRSLLAERGQPDAFVQVLVQGQPSPIVNLVFAITERP